MNVYSHPWQEVKTIKREEAVELLLVNRHFLYRLFYRAFAGEPDRAFLDILTADNTGENFALPGGEVLEAMPAFLAALREKLDDPAFLEALKSEYTRLFVGPMEMEAPPWESVYVGESGMLFQESTLKVRECYRRFGLLPEEYRRVPDDSLALELGFLAELAGRSLDAFDRKDADTLSETLDGAYRFLNEHLLIWIPQLLEKLAGSTTCLLYPRLVQALDSFIGKDSETLKELLTEGVHAHD